MDERLSLRVTIITRVAGISGLVQSLLWIVASIIAIVSYHLCLFERTVVHMNELYGALMHIQYFLSSNCTYQSIIADNEIITAEDINTWMIIMLCFNVCWFLSSVLLCVYTNRVITKNIAFAMYTWIFFGMAIMVVDLTLGALFGLTYTRLGVIITENQNNPDTILLTILQLSTLTLMTLALKGYIVLLANLIILFAMLAIVCDEYTLARDNQPQVRRPPIHAFERMPSIGGASRTTAEVPQLRQKDQAINQSIYRMPSIGGASLATAEVPQLRQKDQAINQSIYRVNTKDWVQRAQPNDSMPFSYTENSRWANPTPHSNEFSLQPVKPRAEERIDNLPYVPDPDYSPLGQRRLKSALKISH